MIDIASIFKDKELDRERLIAFGFADAGDRFVKEHPLMGGSYKAIISISDDADVDLKVYDTDNGEEYMPARVRNASGAFVSEIHRACETVLREVAERCYHAERSGCEQIGRIVRLIKNFFGAEPEFLWSRYPEFGALRVPGKKQWFALIGQIPKKKIFPDEDGMADIIDLKGEPQEVAAHIDTGLAHPAYHMNKRHWFTLVLDDSISDDTVLELVKRSCELAGAKK